MVEVFIYMAVFERVLREAKSAALRRALGKVVPPLSLRAEVSWKAILPAPLRSNGRAGRHML